MSLTFDSNFVPGTEIRKPKVKLVGRDGNAWNIMGLVSQSLKKAKVPKEIIDQYMKESMASDYDHLLRVAMYYADVR